jgi:hypothetical protein
MKRKRFEFVILSIFFLFSVALMWKTLNLTADGNISVATKAWSDFAATIPLIRSFSFGANFPPEYPIFAGMPIRYHFVFFALVGILEKLGIHLVWGLNILSSLAFFTLLACIYYLGKTVFKSKKVGLLSVVFFLFNGSFAFVEFFKKNPLSTDTLMIILENTEFSSFGPYDGNLVSAFWSLNIFTNQRHLALAYAVFLVLILFIYKFSQSPKKLTLSKSLLMGIFIGMFPFIHLAVFGMMGIALITFFAIYPKLRKHLAIISLTALVLSLPQIVYMGASQINTPLINPGYLVENLTTLSFTKYWLFNLGLLVLLFPLGFYYATKKQRKVAFPFLALFLVGNLFQLSVEISANHKFFNLFVIGANLFVSFSLVQLWRKKIYAKIIVSILLLFLTLSGIIDIFPIFNDGYIELKDYPNDPRVAYIVENTPKDAVFLNSGFLYHPASVAGRKIFLGWPYFSWSAGYDTDKRGKLFHQIYTENDRETFCSLLKDNNIEYFTVEETIDNPDLPTINVGFFLDNFESAYSEQKNNFYIFETITNCENPT